MSLCVFLLDSNVSQPVSDLRESIETNFVAPVTIRAASFRIFLSSSDSYLVHLFQTTSAYSKSGRIKENYSIKSFANVTEYSTNFLSLIKGFTKSIIYIN